MALSKPSAPRLTAHTRPYDGVPSALATLSARRPLAVLTNKPLEATRLVLRGGIKQEQFWVEWLTEYLGAHEGSDKLTHRRSKR